VCRVLGLLDQLEVLIPEPAVSPMAQLKSHRGQRQRATRRKATSGAPRKWTWADQT
jgi:hypothetical protein